MTRGQAIEKAHCNHYWRIGNRGRHYYCLLAQISLIARENGSLLEPFSFVEKLIRRGETDA